MTENRLRIWILFLLVLPVIPAAQEESALPAQLVMTRLAPAEYRGGVELELVVRIEAAVDGLVTALGVYETLPPGWIFTGLRSLTGRPPAIFPEAGTAGVLQFAWIDVPAFPCEFAYTVLPPEQDAGLRMLSGQLEYRTDGGRLTAPPVLTELDCPDTVPPEISLQGPSNMIVPVDTPFEDPGVTAIDNADGDISGQVSVTGSVDVTTPGFYVLTYQVTDSAGNSALPVDRNVTVLPDDTDTTTSDEEDTGESTGTTSETGADSAADATNEEETELPSSVADRISRLYQNRSSEDPPRGQRASEARRLLGWRSRGANYYEAQRARQRGTDPRDRLREGWTRNILAEKVRRLDSPSQRMPEAQQKRLLEYRQKQETDTEKNTAPVKKETEENPEVEPPLKTAAKPAIEKPVSAPPVEIESPENAESMAVEADSEEKGGHDTGLILMVLFLVILLALAIAGWRFAYRGPARRRPSAS